MVTLEDIVLNVAVPAVRIALPRVVVPSRKKVTEPVGVPVPGATGETVAVRIKGCPSTDGLGDETTVVVVFALTIWVSAEEVLPLKFASPL